MREAIRSRVDQQRLCIEVADGHEGNVGQGRANPCFSPLVESYLTCVSDTQKQVGVPVKQAAPLLTHDFARLLQDLRQRAQSAGSMSVRTEIARDIALFSLAFDSIRRG